MGGVARLAKQLGHTVSGTDANTYPPMSTQLEALDVQLFEGYSPSNIPEQTDVVVVGNTISRGNPELEAALTRRMRYTSGAQW
jgi:UDP-N-acetylmuramate: L-alanyl-gamma-D-glutamyl-meso-diaminopimelate ligase